ncbi:hypothetical protein [Pseudonocardia charpentierae]|uniref:Uncharacterized protein n=1 Tax=Pseudonocardia charpentierae TaxID=3075545 RepID=A0ABU2NI11_9PSEU|nr:hypothetical protein [Pseudonocardia sp. DSM 45834]MDT0353602.1 hypothetical protein [Pseudonocardia sp. DSM 45834]
MTDDLQVAAPQSELERAAQYFKQWTILGPTGDVTSSNRYMLKNSRIRRFLQYEKQGTFGGINLGWTDDAEPATGRRVTQWQFVRQSGRTAPITYGELVAIRWKDDYIFHAHRDVGINLKWSDNPVFEWCLLGGKPGSPVRTGAWLSIFNTMSEKTGEPLIFFDRTVGGDIGWPSSRTWGQTLREMGTSLAKDVVIAYLTKGSSAKK